MRDVVVFDMDHVISDAAWRDGLLGDWDEYHRAGDGDRPVEEIVGLMSWLRDRGIECWVATARMEKWRDATVRWMVRHSVPVSELLMRPDGDFRKAPAVKIDLLAPHVDRIAFAIDDKEDVCSAYRSAGILAFTYFSTRTYAVELPIRGAG